MILESLKWALSYYKDNGVSSVVLQKKYMGSRASVYLFSKPEDCYFITRNGYRPEIDLHDEYVRLINRFQKDFDAGLQLRILDCELLPWRVLGDSLIDRSFYGYYELAKQEQSISQQYGFDDAYALLERSIDKSCAELTKEEFVKQHGHHVYKNFKLFPYLKKDIDGLEEFKKQVDLYGQDGKTELKPFAILKDVYAEKEVVRITESNFKNFNLINDDMCRLINIEPNFFENGCAVSQEFFEELTTKKGYEGVVVKPEFVKKGVAPYIKVRNPEYLRLVYGHDYLSEKKYKKLCARKRIKRKLNKSIKDFENGLKLLNIPYSQISEDNAEYVNTLIKFAMSERQNEKIDPRL